MSRTRSGAKKTKPATGATTAATTGPLRRSHRLQSKTKGSDHCSVDADFVINSTNDKLFMYKYNMSGPPGVRENAHNTPYCSKPSTGAATATLACLPRRSQRLLQSNVKSSYRFPSGASENAQNTPETTITTVLRRSQRLLQSKAVSLKSCFIDGNTRQGCGLHKKSSVRRLGKTISPVNVGPVKLNFDDVGTVKCNDPIGNNGGNSERRTTRSLSAQNGQGKSGLRIADTDVGVQQGKDSTPLSYLAVNIGKIVQKDDDASKRCVVGELEGTSSESDSPLVSKLEKRCFRRTSKCNKRVGVKRKQKENDDVVQGTDCGWTKEQEKALQRAYFVAKPTPNFWKKVARLVPGKSSQECFDKVNSENLTPRVPQPRSRCKRKTLSPQLEISFSESEMLPEPKSKRKSRRKSHVNQKMVRNLMRKHSHVEPDNKADFFCVLEPTVNPIPEAMPSSPVLLTPIGSAEKGSSSSCRSRSLSNQKKSKSRFSGKSGIPIASPPILKPVRNMALHDKYVDQLHAREAKRKTASSACNWRSTLPKGEVNEPLLKNKDVVRAAKESLISDARDVINKFRHSEMYIESCNDSEEEYDDEEEDDENAL